MLTTPEVITQVTMFIPLQVLYELSVGVAWYWEQPDRAKARRKLALVFGLALGACWLLWFAWQRVWPLISERLH